MSHKIMSIISVGCDFTTKSGGICNSLGGCRNSTREVEQVGQRCAGVERRRPAGPHTGPSTASSTARWTPQGAARRSDEGHAQSHGGRAQSHGGHAQSHGGRAQSHGGHAQSHARRAPHARRRVHSAPRTLAPRSSRAAGPAARAAPSPAVACLWSHPCRPSRSPSSFPRLLALEDASSARPLPRDPVAEDTCTATSPRCRSVPMGAWSFRVRLGQGRLGDAGVSLGCGGQTIGMGLF